MAKFSHACSLYVFESFSFYLVAVPFISPFYAVSLSPSLSLARSLSLPLYLPLAVFLSVLRTVLSLSFSLTQWNVCLCGYVCAYTTKHRTIFQSSLYCKHCEKALLVYAARKRVRRIGLCSRVWNVDALQW